MLYTYCPLDSPQGPTFTLRLVDDILDPDRSRMGVRRGFIPSTEYRAPIGLSHIITKGNKTWVCIDVS